MSFFILIYEEYIAPALHVNTVILVPIYSLRLEQRTFCMSFVCNFVTRNITS